MGGRSVKNPNVGGRFPLMVLAAAVAKVGGEVTLAGDDIEHGFNFSMVFDPPLGDDWEAAEPSKRTIKLVSKVKPDAEDYNSADWDPNEDPESAIPADADE